MLKPLMVSLFSAVFLVLAYRIHVVLQRSLPPDLPELEKLRWLDELGRVAMSTVSQDVYDGVLVSVYTPHRSSAHYLHPAIIYFHGGGWTWLSVGVYDGPLKQLSNSTRTKVIAVEYRKAPQYVFPAAYEDCLAVTRYVVSNAHHLGINRDRIMVAGDGAGGNLAAAIALTTKDKLVLQILINPALQAANFATPSYRENIGLLSGITSAEKESLNWLRYAGAKSSLLPQLLTNQHISAPHAALLSHHFDSRRGDSLNVDSQRYISEARDLSGQRQQTESYGHDDDGVAVEMDSKVSDHRFCPMLTDDISGVTDAYIIVSQFDVLRDEAIMYAHRLLDSGVAVQLRHYRNAFHGFFLFAGGGWITFEESVKALSDLVDYLNVAIN